MKQVIIALLFSIGGVSTNAFGFFGLGGTTWKEEAVQPDGTKIIVERTVFRKGRHEFGQRPPIGSHTLSFLMPGTGLRLKWEDAYSKDVGSANFAPMLLGVWQGRAYVLVSPMGCLAYNKWGRPNPPYVVFRYEGSEWKRIALADLPSEFKLPNLIISSPDEEAVKSEARIIPAEMITQMNQGFGENEYKRILREPNKNAGNGCIRTDYYGKAGWLSQDWFSDQPSLNACLEFCDRKQIDTHACPCRKFHSEEK